MDTDRAPEPWIAAFFTLLLPGLGQLYAGAPRRAAIIFALTHVAIVGIFTESALFFFRAGPAAPMVLLAALLAIMTVDAVRTARNAPRPFVLRPYTRWYVYLGLLVLAQLTVGFPVRFFIERPFYQLYRIPLSSMAPTMLVGDQIVVERFHGSVRRGDIVVYRALGKVFIKRVVGLGGDTLQMRNYSLSVNGHGIDEPYAMPSDDPGDAPEHSTWGPIVIRDHTYFMLGDNRANSLDSREYGSIDADSVIQRPIRVYFSRDSATHAIRWSRIGRSVAR